MPTNVKRRQLLAVPAECWQWKKAVVFVLLVSPGMSKLAKPEKKVSSFTLWNGDYLALPPVGTISSENY